jgi:hypothetical protein
MSRTSWSGRPSEVLSRRQGEAGEYQDSLYGDS